jgi:hypothetical protein
MEHYSRKELSSLLIAKYNDAPQWLASHYSPETLSPVQPRALPERLARVQTMQREEENERRRQTRAKEQLYEQQRSLVPVKSNRKRAERRRSLERQAARGSQQADTAVAVLLLGPHGEGPAKYSLLLSKCTCYCPYSSYSKVAKVFANDSPEPSSAPRYSTARAKPQLTASPPRIPLPPGTHFDWQRFPGVFSVDMPSNGHFMEQGVVKFAVLVYNTREGPPLILHKRYTEFEILEKALSSLRSFERRQTVFPGKYY